MIVPITFYHYKGNEIALLEPANPVTGKTYCRYTTGEMTGTKTNLPTHDIQSVTYNQFVHDLISDVKKEPESNLLPIPIPVPEEIKLKTKFDTYADKWLGKEVVGTAFGGIGTITEVHGMKSFTVLVYGKESNSYEIKLSNKSVQLV